MSLAQVRVHNPLIHNITNIVSAHFSANGLLAIGASPFMSSSPDEMNDIAPMAGALVINLGSLSSADFSAMMDAGLAMNRLNQPVVLDPVGAGATPLRRTKSKELLSSIKVDLIRGNAGEIAYLADVEWQSKGVDAGSGADVDLAQLARMCARQYRCIVALSGVVDYVSDGVSVFAIANGTPLFPKITASGCLLACICGAFLAVVNRRDFLQATINACASYAVAGELASAHLTGNQTGSFYVGLIDALATLDDRAVKASAKVEQVL